MSAISQINSSISTITASILLLVSAYLAYDGYVTESEFRTGLGCVLVIYFMSVLTIRFFGGSDKEI